MRLIAAGLLALLMLAFALCSLTAFLAGDTTLAWASLAGAALSLYGTATTARA